MYTHRIAACQLVEGDRLTLDKTTYLVLSAPTRTDSGTHVKVQVIRDDWEGPLIFAAESRVNVHA